MIHAALIDEMKEFIEKRRAFGPERHREVVLAALVTEGIFTHDYRITPEYGGQRQPEKDRQI